MGAKVEVGLPVGVDITGGGRVGVREDNTETVPPRPVMPIGAPSGDTASALLSPMLNPPVTAEPSVIETTATTPLLIGSAFGPLATQFRVPSAGWHASVFPAAVSADPGAAENDKTLLCGYANVHCRAAGVVTAFNERFK